MLIFRPLATILLSLALASCFIPSASAAQVRLLPGTATDYYAWIVFLSQGPIRWTSKPSSTPGQEPESFGRAYRVVQLTSEIYDTVLIEEITMGNEGFGKKVKAVRQVDLDGFVKSFGFVGEIAGFTFVRWESPTSFRFRFKGREFSVDGLDGSRLRVDEITASNPALQPPPSGAAERQR